MFGDNLLRAGHYGQSKVCRGFDNCYGIPTIRTLCSDDIICYPTDKMYDFFIGAIERALAKIPRDDGRIIYVIPKIGRGYSKLYIKAPKIYEYLMRRLKEEFDYNDMHGTP